MYCIIKVNTVFLFFILLSTLVFPQDSYHAKDSILYRDQWYHTVQIGDQRWLKENLNVGRMITADQQQTDNGITEKYCYENDPVNCVMYGGLYQWDEAMQYEPGGENVRGICPKGWNIPTLDEFHVLISYIDNDGKAFKKEGEGWGYGAGTNTSGFSALLSGYYYGRYMYMDTLTIFWTATIYSPGAAFDICPTAYNSEIYDGHSFKTDGFSVRCLKDKGSDNEGKIVMKTPPDKKLMFSFRKFLFPHLFN